MKQFLFTLMTFLVFGFSLQAQTILDIVAGSADHNTLEAAVIAAELDGALSGDGTFTLFAPTDAAFAAVGQETIDALLADPTGDLADILLFHVVQGQADGTNIFDGLTISSLLGKNLTFAVGDAITINGANISVVDIPATNGIVHVIDAVLLPPPSRNMVDGTILDVVQGSAVHTQLATVLGLSGLDAALSGEGPFTLFAPTDEAFAALPAEVVEALVADPMGALTDVLLYHAVSGVASSDVLSDGGQFSNLAGENLTTTINDQGVFINGSQVTVADIYTNNGVVHVIDAVIVPPSPTTVVDVIVNSPDHTTLETAVIAAGLAETLSGEGPFTVFAPTDAAFAQIDADVISTLLADPTGDLANILLFHVSSGVADSSNLMDGSQISSLLGPNHSFSFTDAGVMIDGVNISVVDIKTSNGVVHVIDGVLLP
jgi:uncharacterized surface protein with fasciclin (FAS1) repeats